jgi:hypothetical protein
MEKQTLNDIELLLGLKPPNISEETLKEMAEFFMKTSVPRILGNEKVKK